MLSFEEFRRALTFAQPGLVLDNAQGKFLAHGRYFVSRTADDEGPIEEFDIGLIVDPRYPEIAPILLELAGRIPNDIDRHKMDDTHCCACVWSEWLETADDISFQGFVDGPLYNYFISQIHFEEHNEWPFGERAHGIEGVIEAVSRLLGHKLDRSTAIRHINTITSDTVKGHWTCVCGSGRKIRDCDLNHLLDLRAKLGRKNILRLKRQLQDSVARR